MEYGNKVGVLGYRWSVWIKEKCEDISGALVYMLSVGIKVECGDISGVLGYRWSVLV